MTVETLTHRIRRAPVARGGATLAGGRNRDHSPVVRSFVVGVTLLVTLAQFFALSHEVAVRHFRCAEHGELTHVAVTSVQYPLAPPRSRDAFRRGEASTPDAHEHCASAFTVRGSSSLPVLGGAGRVAPPPPNRPPPVPAPDRGRAFLLASAPKTSPPAVWS
jgi:hypothetical protein